MIISKKTIFSNVGKFINGSRYSPKSRKKELEKDPLTSNDKVTEKNPSLTQTPQNKSETDTKHLAALNSQEKLMELQFKSDQIKLGSDGQLIKKEQEPIKAPSRKESFKLAKDKHEQFDSMSKLETSSKNTRKQSVGNLFHVKPKNEQISEARESLIGFSLDPTLKKLNLKDHVSDINSTK